MREGSGPFAPPKRLARHASFAWDTQRPGTPGSPNIGFFSNRSQVGLLMAAACSTAMSATSMRNALLYII